MAVDEGKTSEEVDQRAEVEEKLGMQASEKIRARKGVQSSSDLGGFGSIKGKGKGSEQVGLKWKRPEKSLGAINEKLQMEISCDSAVEDKRCAASERRRAMQCLLDFF